MHKSRKRHWPLRGVANACSNFLLGTTIVIRTDHKPLLACIKTKAIMDLTARLQRLRMRFMIFDYDIIYVPGKELFTADVLSRGTIATSEKTPDILSDNIMPYFKHQADITTYKGILCYKTRLIIPAPLRAKCLEGVHIGHQGINSCRSAAKSTMWWPQMNQQIKERIEHCETCIKNSSNPSEPLQATPDTRQTVPYRRSRPLRSETTGRNNKKYVSHSARLPQQIPGGDPRKKHQQRRNNCAFEGNLCTSRYSTPSTYRQRNAIHIG